MGNIPEMTFFESFRIIDSFAEAVMKVKEASEAIRKNGPNLEKWEAEGNVVKKKIHGEISDLVNNKRRLDGEYGKRQLLLKEEEERARKEAQPTIAIIKNLKQEVAALLLEVGTTEKSKVQILLETETEKARIFEEAEKQKVSVLEYVQKKKEECDAVVAFKFAAADKKLAEVEDTIAAAKKGISEL